MAEVNVSSSSLTKAIGDTVRYHKCTICVSCETELNYPYYGKGEGIIFVNKEFEGEETRHGAEKDLEFLKGIHDRYNVETSSYLDFNNAINIHDKIYMQIDRKIQEFVDNIKREDCSVIFVSFATHGGEGGKLIMPDKSQLPVKEIVEKFMIEKLVDIPKVFIFQACRGKKSETPFSAADGVAGEEEPPKYATQRSDIIMVYSTYEGYLAFRGEKGEEGSWFLQILTVCSSLIIDNYSREAKDTKKVSTQTPGYYSTLRKFLRFPPSIQMT